jgi:transposase
MLRVDHARWDQTPADLRELAMSASHPRSRERFLALYEITQESCATRVAERTRRHPQTVMEWLHLYNTRGPEALVYQRTGGRPPHMMVWTVKQVNSSLIPFDWQ